MPKSIQDRPEQDGDGASRDNAQANFLARAGRQARAARDERDQRDEPKKPNGEIQQPGARQPECAQQTQGGGQQAAGREEVDQGAQELGFAGVGAGAGHEAAQVAVRAQEAAEELAGQDDTLGAEPGHEVGRDERQTADQAQSAAERQAAANGR